MNNAGELITDKKNLKHLNEIHLKYVDDFSLAEAINMPKQLVKIPDNEREQPDTYHSRTGHVLPPENSRIQKQLIETEKFAQENQLKVNENKTKLMVFNPCINILTSHLKSA